MALRSGILLPCVLSTALYGSPTLRDEYQSESKIEQSFPNITVLPSHFIETDIWSDKEWLDCCNELDKHARRASSDSGYEKDHKVLDQESSLFSDRDKLEENNEDIISLLSEEEIDLSSKKSSNKAPPRKLRKRSELPKANQTPSNKGFSEEETLPTNKRAKHKKSSNIEGSDEEDSLCKELLASPITETTPRKRLKKLSVLEKDSCAAHVPTANEEEDRSTTPTSNKISRIKLKDDSDNEEIPDSDNQKYLEKFPDFPKKVIDYGIVLKLLTNVYLGRIDETANIFLPKYTLEVKQGDDWIIQKKDFFRTPKKKLCVFASGGTYNLWEKTVAHVFKGFFDEEVKIIRSSWITKHLMKDKGIKRDLNTEFKGRERITF